MCEPTDLEGLKIDAGGMLSDVMYEITDVEHVENAGGSGHKVHLELIEDSTGKWASEKTHFLPEFRKELDEGVYSWRDEE